MTDPGLAVNGAVEVTLSTLRPILPNVSGAVELAGEGVGEGVGDGVGIRAFIVTPLLHKSLFPDFLHENFFPL